MTGAEHAAAPGSDTEGGEQIARRSEITDNSTRPVKRRLGLDYASAIDCRMACTAERRSCPWECPRTGATL